MSETLQDVEVEEVEVETTEESTEELDAGQETEDSSDTESETENGDEEEHKPSRTQNAKQRLRRKLSEAQAEVERLRQIADKVTTLESKLESVINPPKARPSRVDFETEEDYEDSLFEWRDSQRNQKPVVQEQSAVKSDVKPLDVAPEVLENWQSKMEQASDKYDDFEDVIVAIPPASMTDPMTIAIMESDKAGEIAYFLGKNLKEAARIAGLSIASQVKEITKLESKFSKKPTSAPSPISPAKGTDSRVKDVSKMTPEEYRDYRRAQMAKSL